MAAIDIERSVKDLHVMALNEHGNTNRLNENITPGDHDPTLILNVTGQPKAAQKEKSKIVSEVLADAPEATMIVDFQDLQKTKSYQRLIQLEGEPKNRTFLLNRRQLMIGRERSADLRIHDPSVSKFHAMICIRGTQCILKDLNSRNGVIVNGSRIQETKLLVDADKIKIGSHLFAFIEDDPVKPIYRKVVSHSKAMILLATAIIFCILLTFVGALLINPGQNQPERHSIEQKVSDAKAGGPKKRGGHYTAQVYYDTGDAYLKKRLWEKAVEHYRQALELDPALGGIQEAIQQAQFERSCRDIVTKGMALIHNGLHSDAIELIKKIPNHSVYYNDALSGIQAIRNKRRYTVQGASGTIHTMPAPASEILSIVAKDEILTVVLTAGQWHKVLSKFGVMGWMHRGVLRKNRTIASKVDRPADRKLFVNGVAKEDEGLGLLEKSLRHYIDGRIDLSLDPLVKVLQLDLPHASPLKICASASKKAIENIEKLYATSMQHYQNRKLMQAMANWEQALAWDHRLVGPSDSHYSRQIAEHTGDMFYKKALTAIKRGDKEEAKESCSQAFRALKEHKGCVEIMSSLLNTPSRRRK